MKKYPSIDQFRNVIKLIRSQHDYQGKDENGDPTYKHVGNYPTLKFKGTVKLHGTNAAVALYNDRIEFQSRERILALGDDNAGFMTYMSTKNLQPLFENFPFNDHIVIYGEWCGGSIQKSVALNQVEKMFVIFGVMVDDQWVDFPITLTIPEDRIYNVKQFGEYEIEIDFNNPELIQNKLIELTLAVEESCPAGKFFGKEGIGEGIVFTCVDNPEFKFKSKGVKHSVSKVKVLNPVDLELVATINEFVDKVVTENRLKQGIDFFKENNMTVEPSNTGKFISWVIGDVVKEESELLTESGLDDKKVKNAIMTKARMWYLNSIN